VVFKFNDVVKEHITPEQLKSFFEVTEIINELIIEKKVYNQEITTN